MRWPWATWFGTDHPIESDLSKRAQDRRHMTVRKTAHHFDIIVVVGQRLAGEPLSHERDQVIRQIREIAECQMLDLATLAIGMPQEDTPVGLPLDGSGNRCDVDGPFVGAHERDCIRSAKTAQPPPLAIFWLHLLYYMLMAFALCSFSVVSYSGYFWNHRSGETRRFRRAPVNFCRSFPKKYGLAWISP